ncbi:MAG: HAMP domain-containing histidine kinase [Planctomycetia bacterium]|nr:HAMP domain-containing histidine kinase [Planctomycetia bacterium]
MPGKAEGRVAASLPWLCPNTDSLIRLAEAPASLVSPSDPALLAFLLRFTTQTAQPLSGLFCTNALTSALLPETAAILLSTTQLGWLCPNCEVVKRCRIVTSSAAAFARRLAAHTHRACAERASAIATLAPLGWLAMAAVDAGVAAVPFHDLDPEHSFPELQVRVWGLDQDAIARRLAIRWRLPDWIGTVLGNLNLPLVAARGVVADRDLFAVAQLAVLEAERHTTLGLTQHADRAELLKELKLDDATLEQLWSDLPAEEAGTDVASEQNPHKVPLLSNLLKLAAESRRRNGAVLVARLEHRLDEYHRAVADVGMNANARARDAKLSALAELSAGAGHEINNPLAVISGNAQRLLRTEPDPDRADALQAIVRQSQRIAGIVRDLMQFARPPSPKPQRVDVGELILAVRDELSQFALERGVRLEVAELPAGVCVSCDRAQIKHALASVVRNGLEAAGSGGWVRVSCIDGDALFTFVIEDSGPGLSAATVEHAFDPFYCDRSAGRGRGLGLPTAWRFAQQNGGDVRYEPTPDGPTRLVVTVPRSISLEFLDRQSA